MRSLFLGTSLVCVLFACGSSESTVTPTPDSGTPPADAGTTITDSGTTPKDANVPCTDCVSFKLTWGPNGGLVQYMDSSGLASCRTYTHTRTGSPQVVDGGSVSCTTDIGACTDALITVRDVENALADPDVVAAFAAAKTPVYGRDDRPVDGQLFEVTKDGKSIDVGADCTAGASNCVPVPAGVRALEKVLNDLDTQELAKAGCASFPKP